MRKMACPYLSVRRSRYQELYVEWNVLFGKHAVMEKVDSYHINKYKQRTPFFF